MEQLKILVVDDDKEIVDSIAIFLQADGYAVEKAYNGLEALDIVMTQTVHLLLLDIMMPEMDGIKTLLKVRESKNIPIILISAKSEDADKILGLRSKASCGAIRSLAQCRPRRRDKSPFADWWSIPKAGRLRWTARTCG